MREWQVKRRERTRHLIELGGLVAKAGGAILRRYVPGPGEDEPVVWYEGSSNADRRWLHADERGSVVAVSDASGAMLAINRYDEYGIPQSGNVGRFQYTGQAWLPELGMQYSKARIYSPTLGRFMQTDPIGYGDGLNWYNYVGSDPVNSRDPSGLEDEIVVTGIRSSPLCPLGYEQTSSGGCQDRTQLAWNLAQIFNVPQNYSSGNGGSAPAAPASSQKQQGVSPCMQKFLASQGLGAPNLGSVKFQEGDGGSLIAKGAFAHGNPAVTVQNNVYVKPGHWGSFSPGSAGFFEEVLHTIQWDQSGAANFGLSWVLGSAMGALATGDAHNSPIEAQAGGWSKNLARAYAASGGCPK